MTQVSPAPSISGPVSIRQIPSGNGGETGFSLALGGVERPGVTVPRPAPEPADAETEARQAVAGTGKDLPGEDAPAGAEDERGETDVAFAWFGMALPAPEAAPVAVMACQPATVAIALPEGEAAPLPAIMLPGQERAPGFAVEPAAVEAALDAASAEIAKAIEAAAAGPVEIATEAPVRRIQGIDMSRLSRADAPARIELPANSPILQTLAALQPRAEANPLAAMLAPGIELPEQFRGPAPRDPAVAMLTPVNGLEMQRAGVVQAVAEIQQAAIDTRRSDWMTSTIERIEALRDSPNSRETSLRLSPDALGKVDVSIRQEGDRIHVRFTAETAAARTLLTEAQSRLNDIAEARGLKLGQTSVDSGVNAGGQYGAGGQGQRQDAAPRTNTASAPATASGGETETTTDDRVA